MINQFTQEIRNLESEVLALKTEKMKILSQLKVKETHITVTSSQYRFTIKPTNNVMPLISFYIDSDTNPGVETIHFASVNPTTFEFDLQIVGTYSDFDLVLLSTSELEIS